MTSISLDTGVFIEDDCAMRFEVTPDGTYIVFGDSASTLSVGLSDRALANLVIMIEQWRGNVSFPGALG